MNKKAIVLLALLAPSGDLWAWNGGHSVVGRSVLDSLPEKWRARWNEAWRRDFYDNTHAPDSGRLFGLDEETKWLQDHGWSVTVMPLHYELQVMFMYRLANAIRNADWRTAFLLAAVLSHDFADPGAMNHDPMTHHALYVLSPQSGLAALPPLELDLSFCLKNANADRAFKARLADMKVPAAEDFADWKALQDRLLCIEGESLGGAISVRNSDIIMHAAAWHAKPTPENAAALGDALADPGLWGVKWTLWALATAERLALRPLPDDLPTYEQVKAYKKKSKVKAEILLKRSIADDQLAARFLPKEDRPCRIGVMYDRAGHHSEGIAGITGNVRAISTAASLKALFPEENPGLLDWRKYDHEDIDQRKIRLVVVFADMGCFLGFNPSAFVARVKKYVENGGKVIWVSERGADLVVPSLHGHWKTAPTKRVYAHSTFPVEEKLVPDSKIVWDMFEKRELSFLRPTFCGAGWTWSHSCGYCAPEDVPADVRPVTRFVAPDGRSFVQGAVWPKPDPRIAVLPPYALFGWVFSKEMVSLDPVTFRFDTTTEAMLSETVRMLLPKYEWRGYMLDVSRHFFTVDQIKRTMDQMQRFRLNVFHWHLTDDRGWRLQIDKYPALTTKGAVRTDSSVRTSIMHADGVDGRYGPFFYTKDDVRDIVKYAAERGIRVIPEIEIPGHESAAIKACPELGCDGLKNIGEFCLGKDSTVHMLEDVFDEVVELFPDEVVHIGGDECKCGNWKQCKKCQERIRQNNLDGVKGLQGWVTCHFANCLAKKGRRLMGWDEIAECPNVPKSAIVMSYRGCDRGICAATNGFDVVMTPSDYCYLDYEQGIKGDLYEYQPFGCVVSTRKIARFNPAAGVPTEFRHHILGGQGNMWTELVYDWKGVEWRTWPRLAALGDVLANGPAKDVDAFVARQGKVREELVGHGVNAAPVAPLFDPFKPGLDPMPRVYRPHHCFANMLDNPLDRSIIEWDHKNLKDKYRKLYARRDASMSPGSYRLKLSWPLSYVTVADDKGIDRALEVMRKLARPKVDGHMEFQAADIED